MPQVANATLDTILSQFRDDARNNRDLGDRFERLMQQFFRVDPLYAGLFSEVWMWNEWPLKGQVGDVGIDLVAASSTSIAELASTIRNLRFQL
jgi:predicted helicase